MHREIRSRFLTGLVLATVVFGVSCSPGTVPSTPTVAPTTVPTLSSTSTPSQSPTPTIILTPPIAVATAVSNAQLRLDLDAIFPAGPGRDLLLNNCTGCHTFLRIVVGRRSKDQWDYVKRDMRGKVSQLSDQDVDTLFAYLEANFNDAKPVPNLPNWFLQTGEW